MIGLKYFIADQQDAAGKFFPYKSICQRRTSMACSDDHNIKLIKSLMISFPILFHYAFNRLIRYTCYQRVCHQLPRDFHADTVELLGGNELTA